MGGVRDIVTAEREDSIEESSEEPTSKRQRICWFDPYIMLQIRCLEGRMWSIVKAWNKLYLYPKWIHGKDGWIERYSVPVHRQCCIPFCIHYIKMLDSVCCYIKTILIINMYFYCWIKNRNNTICLFQMNICTEILTIMKWRSYFFFPLADPLPPFPDLFPPPSAVSIFLLRDSSVAFSCSSTDDFIFLISSVK